MTPAERSAMKRLHDLWSGRLPLNEALWDWGVLRGLLLNLGCTLAALWLWLGQDAGPFATGALVIHFLPVPYNVAFVVGVWRSAADPQHSHRTRILARAGAVALAILYMVI
jgi:hypothetical protein